ncbi:hypothetical protein TNCV_4554371 [Trichonephila clavipes]|nr:hypothetical protein TNCV_4554371 [Trichonephila clavipes]
MKVGRALSTIRVFVLPLNWFRIELNHTVTCMVLKAMANDRRYELALCAINFVGLDLTPSGRWHQKQHIFLKVDAHEKGKPFRGPWAFSPQKLNRYSSIITDYCEWPMARHPGWALAFSRSLFQASLLPASVLPKPSSQN